MEQKPAGRPIKADKPTAHFNIYLTDELARDLRIFKARSGQTIQEIVTEAIAEYLHQSYALTEPNEDQSRKLTNARKLKT